MMTPTLLLLLLCLWYSVCCPGRQLMASADESVSAIVQENMLPGTRDWWIPQAREDPVIQGFTESFSYNAGEEVVFKIDCLHLQQPVYNLLIYRLGYYKEAGGRLIATLSGKRETCFRQEPCMYEKSSRMVDCDNWKPSLAWRSPSSLLSGVYVALPVAIDSNTTSHGGYIPFIIRPHLNHTYDILFKTSDLTWVAYNKYGGWNVYGGQGSKAFSSRALKASYNRPFANRLIYPIGQQQNFLFSTEFPMLFWLEKHGYNVAYVSCTDVEALHQQKRLRPTFVKVLLSIGHDEYWTAAMKLAYTDARNHGVHLGFFSGNEMFWRVVWEDDYRHMASFSSSLKMTDKLPTDSQKRLMKDYNTTISQSTRKRVFVCKKESIENISSPTEDSWTGTFVDPRHRNPTPENAITGQRFMVNSYRNDSLIVPAADSKLRFWRHTNVFKAPHGKQHSASRFYRSPAGVLGYELDGYVEDLFRPPGMITLSHTSLHINNSLVQEYGAAYRGSGSMTHRITMYRHHIAEANQRISKICQASRQVNYPNSSLVFSTGTIQWPWALSSFRDGDSMEEDANLQQATINILADMGVFPSRLITKVNKSNRSSISGKVSSNQLNQLQLAKSSSDKLPPTSSISSVRLQLNRTNLIKAGQNTTIISRQAFNFVTLKIAGTATDLGKGKVATVEVSLNGGKNWHVATGRERWTYTHSFVNVKRKKQMLGFFEFNKSHEYPVFDSDKELEEFREALVQRGSLYDEHQSLLQYKIGSLLSIVVVTRAVDDSGWIERTGANIEKALCKMSSGEVCTGNCTFSNNIRIVPFEVTK